MDYVPDDGVYEAYYSGKSPHQRDLDFAAFYCQGEDCLYLDIWKAEDTSAEKKPVMVWIHGGAYEIEGAVDPWYDLHNFVKDNPDAQNLGLMDQMMALKWVHENISNFGGDPDNVTIFGESGRPDSPGVPQDAHCTKRRLRQPRHQSGNKKSLKRFRFKLSVPSQRTPFIHFS